MNDLDQVVGWSFSANGTEAFFWSEETGMIGLGDFPGGSFFSKASAINNHGQVVGYGSYYGDWRAFVWTVQDGMRDLGDLESECCSGAYDINDRGFVVGAWAGRAFIWHEMTGMIPLELFPFPHHAYRINNRNVILGRAYPPGRQNPDIEWFIWDDENGARMLADLVDISSQHYLPISEGQGINDVGQITIDIWGIGGGVLTPYLLGDMNCDGVVNNFDVAPFVEALLDMDAYLAAHPDCWLGQFAADVNQDARVDNFDIDPFLALLIGP